MFRPTFHRTGKLIFALLALGLALARSDATASGQPAALAIDHVEPTRHATGHCCFALARAITLTGAFA